jgi:uncharacterized protein YkwD
MESQMPYRRSPARLVASLATALAILGLTACAGERGELPGSPQAVSDAGILSLTDFGRATLDAINEARSVARQCGETPFAAAAPVQWDPRLSDAALMQAEYLQQNNLFTHTGAGDSSVGDRALAVGYDWTHVGENLAAGHRTLERVMIDWIASPGHCATLMNPNFVDAGFAVIPGEAGNAYRSYWALVMGRPRR